MNIFKKILGVAAAGIFIVGGWLIIKNDGDKDVVKPTGQAVGTKAAVPAAAPATASASGYKNGSYTATGQYDSPAGTEQVTVSVVIKGNVIADATVTADSANRRSQKYQQMFISGFKQYVVGKKVDDVALDVVSGSSLTPEGFNDALATIKQQAKA